MDYTGLQESVATRLNRSDLLTAVLPSTQAIISTIIQDRILYYQRLLYSPSQQQNYDITTIQSQNTYMLPQGTQSITMVRLLLGGIWRPLWRVDWFEDILAVDLPNPPFITLPSYWCTFGQAIRFYPTPNIAYPIELVGTFAIPAPVNPTDINWWTTEAQTLIIEAACADICRLYINDEARANAHQAAANREHDSLKTYTRRLRGPSQARAYL